MLVQKFNPLIKQCYLIVWSLEKTARANIVKKIGKTILLLNCAACGSKKSKFIEEHKAKSLLGNLLWTKMPVLGHLKIFCITIKQKK